MSAKPLAAGLERAIDAGLSALAFAHPHAALAAAALAKTGFTLRDLWEDSAAARLEDAQTTTVVFEAAVALAGGDPDVAEAHLRVRLADPAFRATLRATVNRMRESCPCDAALTPLGLLIAQYVGQRPDAEFRRFAGLLSDADDAALVHLRGVVVELMLDPIRPRLQFAVRRPDWFPTRINLEYAHGDIAVAVLLEHGLVSQDQLSGGSRQIPPVTKISRERLTTLAILLGVPHTAPATAPTPDNA